MSDYCGGELNGICCIALSLRGRVTFMDAYLFGQMDPAKAARCIYHNYVHHGNTITEQVSNLERIVAARVQQYNTSDDFNFISTQVFLILREAMNDTTARERLIRESLNWEVPGN